MKITITKKYKSLNPFESDELSPLTIITGLNGSGKSQLLEQFRMLSESNDQGPELKVLQTDPKFKRIHTSALLTETISTGSPETYKNQLTDLHSQYKKELQNEVRKIVWRAIKEKQIEEKSLIEATHGGHRDARVRFRRLFNTNDYQFTSETITSIANNIANTRNKNEDQDCLIILNHYSNFYKLYKKCVFISNNRNKNLFELTHSDFLQAVVPETFLDQNDLISSRLENIFYSYLKKRELNAYQYFRKQTFGERNSSISREQFNTKNPSPWLIINDALKSNGLNYFFKEIKDDEFSPDANITFEFIKGTDQVIPFSDLSSGEKVIIGLIIKLFTTKFYDYNLAFPDLIFLDEPDAHLHPQLSKLLIDVLNETMVKKLGIQVIITTHSPSTVALAPAESIYELRNWPKTELVKVNKDQALKLLTTGLPNLSIDYENHRQVFVESPTDRLYYQTIFDKLLPIENYSHRLYFISNGYGKGNCNQVIDLVSSLRNSGNKTSFGIVDWDKKERQNDYIHIHGRGARYSIENFIFDPLYLSILLIELRYGEIQSAIGYQDSDNQYEIIKNEKGQLAIDFIMCRLNAKFPHDFADREKIICKYGKTHEFNLERSFLIADGHKLKEKIKMAFPPLQSLRRSEYEIEEKLINIIGKMFPIIPEESRALFTKLAF